MTEGPGYQWVGWILLITAGLTAYYTFRVFFRVFVGPQSYEPGDELHDHDDHGEEHAHDAGQHGDHHADHFHPHAPGWAINTVLAILAACSIASRPARTSSAATTAWVGEMVHHSSADNIGTAAFLDHSASSRRG